MSYEQFKQIIIKIESHCLKFKLEDYQIKFWWNKLKDYDYEDISYKIDQHFDGELSYTAPTLSFLMKNVLTVEQKKKQNKIYIKCPLCKKKYEYPIAMSDWKKCHQRCSMITNIIDKCNKYGIDSFDFFGGDIGVMKLSDIEKNYVRFLYKVYSENYDKLTEQEKNIMKHIFDTDPRKNEQIKLV